MIQDLQHHLFLLSFGGKLFFAPVKQQIHNCLDVGTGTGIWAMDFGQLHDLNLILSNIILLQRTNTLGLKSLALTLALFSPTLCPLT
jgi:hypothetical protein